MTVGIVDYDAGNLKSVQRALSHIGTDHLLSRNPDELLSCDRLIFPGVGEAFSAMKILKERKLDRAIRDFFETGRPVLGICLGCQIILEYSAERSTDCMGIIPGQALRFPKSGLKVPQIGWNEVRQVHAHPLWRDIPDNSNFYFVHSYYPLASSSDFVLGTTEYGIEFTSAIVRNNLAAFQFHPEKSGPVGLKLLSNFLAWDGGAV